MNTVQIDAGLRLDDRNAERFVDMMLDDLRSFTLKAMQKWRDECIGSTGMMNPKAQQRGTKRLIRALGSTCLSYKLDTGNRGRFRLMVLMYSVTDKNRLCIDLLKTWSEGGRHLDAKMRTVVTLSHHALVRLLQRAEVRSAMDFVGVLAHLTPGCGALVRAVGVADIPEGRVWPVPIRNNSGARVIPLAVNTPDEGVVITTVYKGVWKGDSPALDRLEELFQTPKQDPAELHGAFTAAARHFN